MKLFKVRCDHHNGFITSKCDFYLITEEWPTEKEILEIDGVSRVLAIEQVTEGPYLQIKIPDGA